LYPLLWIHGVDRDSFTFFIITITVGYVVATFCYPTTSVMMHYRLKSREF